MGPNERTRLDEMLAREPAATLRILHDVVDVEQRLKELYRRLGVDQDPVDEERPAAPTMTD